MQELALVRVGETNVSYFPVKILYVCIAHMAYKILTSK